MLQLPHTHWVLTLCCFLLSFFRKLQNILAQYLTHKQHRSQQRLNLRQMQHRRRLQRRLQPRQCLPLKTPPPSRRAKQPLKFQQRQNLSVSTSFVYFMVFTLSDPVSFTGWVKSDHAHDVTSCSLGLKGDIIYWLRGVCGEYALLHAFPLFDIFAAFL